MEHNAVFVYTSLSRTFSHISTHDHNVKCRYEIWCDNPLWVGEILGWNTNSNTGLKGSLQ